MMIKKQFKQTHNFNYYTVFWLIVLAIVIYLGLSLQLNRKLIGIVESKSHLVSAGESGKIQTVLISVGDHVNKDQVMAMLDISDLKTNLDQLKQKLASLRQIENAQQDRSSIEMRRLALQLENEASDLIERLSTIESQSTELASLNTEIERLKNAESAGLGYSRELIDLQVRRDALATYLNVQRQDLEFQRRQLEKTRQSRKLLEDADMNSMTRSLLMEQMEYAEELQRLVAETEYRITMRTIVAPCDGYVTNMLARPGDVVDAFIPIFTVEEGNPTYVDVFIPERYTLTPETGMKVEINSSRLKGYKTTGVISFVHPNVALAAERLVFQGQFVYARKVRVELPQNHQFIPGELVTAHIYRNARKNNVIGMTATASANHPVAVQDHHKNHPPLVAMNVPDILWQQTRFEPSGIAWLSDINKYLIISDDTGIKDTPNDHAAFLFLMDEHGNVDPTYPLLHGIEIVNDLEAIAPADAESFYLVSSQNISKQGKRPASRELIIKIKRNGDRFVIQGKVHLLSLLLDSCTADELKLLGLDIYDEDGKPLLNIEGAAFHDNALYLGLREPVSEHGAIIWKLEHIDRILNGRKLSPNQLSIYGYVQLGPSNGKTTGISDLLFDQHGVLWVLSTGLDQQESIGTGGMHRIDRSADGHLDAERIYAFPDLKPEGICIRGDDRFVIVFDNDNETPVFCHVNVKDL